MSSLFNRGPRVRAFGGNDSEFAWRNFFRIGSRVQARGEISRATDAQLALVDSASMLLGDVVGVNFHIREAREVCPKNTAYGATADDANLHAHAVFRASRPV